MTGIVLIIVLAIVVEAFIEYGKSIGKAFIDGEWKTAVTQLIAIAVAVAMCIATAADLFAVVGLVFAWPWLGTVLTGILISRGANYVSDFVKRLQGVQKSD